MRISRSLQPLAWRIGRAERAVVVAFARARHVSVSGLLKTALRQYLAAQPASPTRPVRVWYGAGGWPVERSL